MIKKIGASGRHAATGDSHDALRAGLCLAAHLQSRTSTDASRDRRARARRLLIAAAIAALAFSLLHAAAAHAAARSVRVNFTNRSDSALTLTQAELDHGCWTNEGEANEQRPPSSIAIGQQVFFESESCGFATGTEFHVKYKVANGSELEMHYDVPFCSNIICEVDPTCNDSAPAGYEMHHEGCGGTNPEVVVTFSVARSISLHLQNTSDSVLTLTKAELVQGCWENKEREPPARIPFGEAVTIESKSCADKAGAGFHLVYKLANGQEMEATYVNPFEGSPEYREATPPGYRFNRASEGSHNLVLQVSFGCDSTGCDGIPDEWKKNGVTINPKTGRPAGPGESGEFINLPAMGVSLERPNILIQMDWMQETEGKKRNQRLRQASINQVIEAFNKDPETYPGATRPGITLIVDNGPDGTITPGGKEWGGLSKAKAIPWQLNFLTGTRKELSTANFETLVKNNLVPSGRKPIFHYAVAVAKLAAEAGCTSGVTPNRGTKEGFGFIVSLGGERKAGVPCWAAEVGSENQQTGTFMHELGHAIGLSHGGEDSINNKPNYPSIMNYLFQMVGVLRNEERVWDYSREPETALEEKTLTEAGGFGSFGTNPLKYGISWVCPTKEEPSKSTSNLKEVDWNCDNPEKIEAGEGYIVNGTGGREAEGKEELPEILRKLEGTANSDWRRIDFHTGGVGTGTAGENDSFPVVERDDEMTPEIAERMRIQPRISYTGALSSDYHDRVTASATLVDPSTKTSPLVGASITFTLGASSSDACTGTTGSSGVASCTITPTQEAGKYNVVASFAGDATYQPVSDTQGFTISPEETTLSYTGPTVILAGASGATLSATLVEDGSADNDSDGGSSAPVPSESVTLAIGSQACSGKTDASGNVSCTIPSVTTALGPQSVGAAFAGDGYYAKSSDRKTAIVFAFPSRGAFTLGDKTVAAASEATKLTWWADMWSSRNSLSGSVAPPSFKGFAGKISLPTTTPPAKCGSSWTTTGGNSPPPSSGVPSYMGTVVTSKVTKSGETIAGNTVSIVVVKTIAGYSPEPSRYGTGTIVAKFC